MDCPLRNSSRCLLWCLIAVMSFVPTAKSLELYFIGNSLTAIWDIPSIMDSLGAHANPPLAIHSRSHIIAGSEISAHLMPEVFETIRTGGFDFVILQSYQDPYLNPQAFYSASRQMNDSIVASGARTAFFMQWAMLHLDRTRSGFGMIAARYDSIGVELGAPVAPAGRAWETLFLTLPQGQLYIDDVHESKPGAYLAACVIFATVTGRTPVGNTYNPVTTPYTAGFGTWSCDSSGAALQRLAWATANGYNVLDKTPPSAPTGLSAQALSPTGVRLAWTPGVDAESRILRARIYRNDQYVQDTPGQNTVFTDTGLTESTLYSYQVSAINVASLEGPRSSPASVTTLPDVTGPMIAAVYAGVSVLVEFNEPVEQASAQNAANYAIDNGVSVASVLLQSNGRIVALTVSPLTQGVTYTLTVNNIRDRAKTANAIAPDSKITFQVRPGLSKIRFYPRAGLAARMAGGVFEGSNGDPASGPYSPLYAIGASPANDQWTEVANLTNNDIGYRYIRYRAGGNCNIAEIEFYRGTKLAGTPFGSPGSYGNSGNDFRKAFDGDVSTYFDFSTETGGYTGMDTEGGSPAVRTPCATASERNLLHFSVSGNRLRVTSAASVILTNTQGMVVLRRQLNGPGIVDLSALARGVYAVSGAKNVNEIRRAAVVVR